MALHAALVAALLLAALAATRAHEAPTSDGRNAQNENALHSILTAIIHTMVTTASPHEGEDDRAADELQSNSPRAASASLEAAVTPSARACSAQSCPQEGAEGPHAHGDHLTVVQAPLDALIDFAIGFAVHKYALIHGGRFPMDDIGEGRLRLREGSMGDLRNVFRKEPVALRRALVEGRPALLLSFSGGFRFVDVHYRYQYSIPLISHSGYVQGSLSPVVVVGQLLLQLPCHVRLLRLYMSQVGELRLNGTGFWPLNGVVFGLLRDIADATARRTLLKVVDDIRKQIQAVFDAIDCTI